MGSHGILVYGLLFLIIFIETGLVFVPFLPGDSILFVCGSLAAIDGGLNLLAIICGFIIAAVLGDWLNFELGQHFGSQLKRFIKPKHMQASEHFYSKYGKIAIFLGRFVPIVRTIVPFTAGMSRMPYRSFFKYNIIGAIAWICLMTITGFYFGNLAIVKNNFELVSIGIVILSLMPILVISLRHRLSPVVKDDQL
ncbi:cytochrome O ubiquinol oxidase [Oenococcus sicerae]|uniref:Cytochrome O ubiquinol oxidase n=2 Tax=Oenococcus sicerae TaxID=2203724 RepID=A0AAJ1RCX5_9LACO|nr:cytochrome O ubiquinol oxidase [Oenococcus sicerae]QAS70658.1 cytochrome O ubiquinol oxidase [Oenococcus sicerae]